MVDVHFNLVNDSEKNIHGYLPERVEKLSTGYDVRNAGPDIELVPFQKALIPLGFRAIIPEGWYFELYPRSSTFHKKSVHSLYGVIDEWDRNNLLKISNGDRIAQIILRKRFDFNVIASSDEEFDKMVSERGAKRGIGGFGSTGDK